jgi:hypothetical protein
MAPRLTLLPPRYATLEGPYADRIRSCGQAQLAAELKIVDDLKRSSSVYLGVRLDSHGKRLDAIARARLQREAASIDEVRARLVRKFSHVPKIKFLAP